MNRGALNSAPNSSAPSVGASSLVTDANSSLSGGPHLQSASINTESYLHLPASPMSFSSNNISGSSMMDGSSIVQQSSHQGQMQKQGSSTATSQPTSQETVNMLQLHKKTRLDVRQEDILQQQAIQQLLQRQDSLQLQGQLNPQLQTLIQQQRMLQQRQQQQQILQSLPPMQRAQMQQQQQQQQQQQLRQQLQQQMMQSPHLRRPFDSGICARRLMQYLYHQRHRPPENTIFYWRKFVSEYFAPRAKKRWCLSLYDNVGNHTLGVFPQAAMDAWHCEICGSKSGKGFEASFEVLARLNKIKFDSGVIDEILFLDMPRECRLASGMMLLEYAKATQECVYEHLRVVREGHLRIIFTPDLKLQSKRVMAAPNFDVHRGQRPTAEPKLDVQRAQLCHLHVRALNTQFASWVQNQLQNHPDELWQDGAQDYIAHASQIMEKFSDVVAWVRTNAQKAPSTSVETVSNSQKSLVDGTDSHKTKSQPGMTSAFSTDSRVPHTDLWSSALSSGGQKSVFPVTPSSFTKPEASEDQDEENEAEKPSSPSLKRTEEKGIVVVHEVKCKLYVKPDNPGEKGWKDMGVGQLSIKCKEGAGKATKESKPTIVIRNDVGKILLNALIYPGIKMNIQKNTIASVFHTLGGPQGNGDEAGKSAQAVARTYLLRMKNEEETAKLAAAINENAPSS